MREVGFSVSVKESNGHLKSENFLATMQNSVAKFLCQNVFVSNWVLLMAV